MKGNYKEIRKSLAHIDWNDNMKNKTATECWNILRGGAGRNSGEFFFLMNFELLPFPCREMIKLSIHI